MFAPFDTNLFKMETPNFATVLKRLNGIKSYKSLKEIISNEEISHFTGPTKKYKVRAKTIAQCDVER